MRVLSLCGVIGFMLVTVGGCADKQGAPENAVAKQTTSTRAAPDSPDKEGGKIGLPGEPVAGVTSRPPTPGSTSASATRPAPIRSRSAGPPGGPTRSPTSMPETSSA